MKEIVPAFREMELISNSLQFKLLKGKVSWEDHDVQYFLPVVLSLVDFDWLRLIAENNCIEEDEKIIKNFIDMCESLRDVNSNTLRTDIEEKMKKRFK